MDESWQRGLGQGEEIAMEARIVGELGVERGGQELPLAGGDDPFLARRLPTVGREEGQHLAPLSNPLEDRRPDEDGPERALRFLAQGGHREIRDEAIYLPPEGVALHSEIHQFEQRLFAARVAGAEYRDGAGTPDRLLPAKSTERLD